MAYWHGLCFLYRKHRLKSFIPFVVRKERKKVLNSAKSFVAHSFLYRKLKVQIEVVEWLIGLVLKTKIVQNKELSEGRNELVIISLGKLHWYPIIFGKLDSLHFVPANLNYLKVIVNDWGKTYKSKINIDFLRENPLSKRGRKPRTQTSRVFALCMKSVTNFDVYNNG